MIGQTAGILKAVKVNGAVSEYTIAKFASDDDTMGVATAASDEMLGIFQHAADAAGETVRVMLSGISRLRLGGTVTRGSLLTTNSSGQGVAATQHTHTENTAGSYTQNATTAVANVVRVIGRALASGVSGDIIPVLLAPGVA